ncbi:MAG: protein kinase [Candidatus Yanofskybacteria bacterium]|nr:protein kinase [Candidatus Yanofskybacteria bacterium]
MITLTEEFKKAHDIKDVLDCFDNSGQKIVYIVVDKNGNKMAMKSFRNCSKRDIQEIEILKRFKGLNGISRVVRVEDNKGAPILFEKYIDAPDLEDIIVNYAAKGTEIAALIKNIAEVLRPIWEAKIVHRDLKPKNIKILPDGKPVILDFGIARDLSAESITETGEDQPMTWNYASPEQYAKDKGSISYRTDFFVLGEIAYVLYYQRHPFGASKDEVAKKFTTRDNAIQLDNNCPLNPFLQEVLSTDPSARPRNVDLFISKLTI